MPEQPDDESVPAHLLRAELPGDPDDSDGDDAHDGDVLPSHDPYQPL